MNKPKRIEDMAQNERIEASNNHILKQNLHYSLTENLIVGSNVLSSAKKIFTASVKVTHISKKDEGELKRRLLKFMNTDFAVASDAEDILDAINEAKKEFPILRDATTLDEFHTEAGKWFRKWFGSKNVDCEDSKGSI